MSPQASTTALKNARALLVFAALVSLCVSNNVGPQFFPLIVAEDRVAQNSQEDHHDQTSCSPSQAGENSYRVPMMARSQKRAAKGPPQADPLVALLDNGFGLPRDARFATEVGYPVSFLTSASGSQTAGRAPPAWSKELSLKLLLHLPLRPIERAATNTMRTPRTRLHVLQNLGG